ncbi:MAG TPA: M42 family metallopeptidase [Gemmataceae bacterium]|jgi:endoglucanase
MHDASLKLLRDLLETPSASGFERAIQDVVRAWAGRYADEVRTDRHGNVIAAVYPKDKSAAAAHRVMLAGHCDQIALMVQHVDENGFLYVQPIGGWDMQILLGQHLTVWAREGPIPGVIARRATHLLTPEERAKVPQFIDVWVDIGAKDRAEAEKFVRAGDPVTFALGMRELRNGLAAAPGMDDKVGVWTVLETLRLLHGRPLQAAVYAVSTVQEEVGLRGATTSAHGINPTVGIAVDVTHATDTPGNDKKQLGETKVGDGPVLYRGPNINPRVFDRLEEAAKANEIPVQVRGAPRATGTDANAIQISRDGVAAAVVGIPNRYMHSPVEVVALADLERAARLLAEFCAAVTADGDWTP